MLNILIIEDEAPAVKRLIKLLGEIDSDHQIVGQLDEVSSAIKWLESNPTPDLIFMDIQLADGYSFQIFEQFEIKSPVIFVTAFDNYAIDAFRVNGLDYLLKPIKKELLVKSIERFKSLKSPKNVDLNALSQLLNPNKNQFKERFLIKSGDELSFVKTNEIAYFISEDSYSFIITKSGSRYIYTADSISQIEEQLDPTIFFKINRKEIVSLDSITKISAYFNNRLKLELKPVREYEFIVSRPKVKAFKIWLDQ
ncbi:MAG: LytR/AlgR family response regulator transcription factor [Crocinitomicaceae bacterium]